ncbi:DUF475 domain-containing protein [Bartonella sp. DGB1]|uniref:DUF475 domain-containing protein n=1 Tax=Bartonella sp. DGB1 TaxID=3239807 RepID=UPI0035232E53
MKSFLFYCKYSLWITFLSFSLVALLGYLQGENLFSIFNNLLIAIALVCLEVSLSFDNAVINARILKNMSEKWQKYFLTWGILIAVFGMRVLFPIILVSFFAGISLSNVVELAIFYPEQYAAILHESHILILAFAGSFLMLVAVNFFIDNNKKIHWFNKIECFLTKNSYPLLTSLLLVFVIISFLTLLINPIYKYAFFMSSVVAIVIFFIIESISYLLNNYFVNTTSVAKSGLIGFLYLELLDASFSFDGVIGAFSLTNNLFIIAVGLGIGAFFIRSFTLMLVETGSLTKYRYLEHGAFYAVLALAVMLYIQLFIKLPEIFMGIIGILIISYSLFDSFKYNKKNIN